MLQPTEAPEVNKQSFVSNEAEVRNFMQDLAKALRAGRVEDIMKFYATDLTVFDMMPPLSFTNKQNYQTTLEDCYTNYFQFPVQYDYHQQKISTEGNFAFIHSVIHLLGTAKKGEVMECWMRNTAGLEYANGRWLITHEHSSVPLEMETGKGLMNLKPESEVH